MARVVTLTWEEFFAQGRRAKKSAERNPRFFAWRPSVLKTAGGVLAGSCVLEQTAWAMSPQTLMMHAFQPVIALIQGVSFPIAFIMFSGGMLLIMVGQRHRGLTMIKWAAVGYVGMQLVPGLMGIVAQVGHSLATGF